MNNSDGFNFTHFENVVHETSNSIVYLDNNQRLFKISKSQFPGNSIRSEYFNEYEVSKDFLENPYLRKTNRIVEFENRIGLEMDFVEGESLKEALELRKFSLDDKIELMKNAARCVFELHKRSIIHKDVSAANFIINDPSKLSLTIIDYGLAKSSTLHSISSDTGVMEGNLYYVAPEQTGRMLWPVDYRSDLYSLGILFYRILVEEYPFRSTDLMELIHLHIAKEAVIPDSIRSKAPSKLIAIIEKLLQKNPDKRFQSAYGLLHDLESSSLEESDFEIAKQDIPHFIQASSQLIGRDSEFEQIAQLLQTEKSSVWINIVGESGVGKTSFANQIYYQLLERGKEGFSYKVTRRDALIEFHLIEVLSKKFLQMIEQSSPTTFLKIAGDLALYDKSTQEVLTKLYPPLQLNFENRVKDKQVQKEVIYSRLWEKIATYLCAFVVLIDDLQWVDRKSLGFITERIDHPDFEITWLTTSRNQQEGKAPGLEVLLENLSLDSIKQYLLKTMCLSESDVSPLASIAHQKTLGNPGDLQSFLDTILREGKLYFDTSQWRWAYDLASIQSSSISDSWASQILENFKTIGSNEIKILKLCSELGFEFSLNDVCKLSELEEKHCLAILNELSKANYIVQCIHSNQSNIDKFSDVSSMTFRFSHDKIFETTHRLFKDDQNYTETALHAIDLFCEKTHKNPDYRYDFMDRISSLDIDNVIQDKRSYSWLEKACDFLEEECTGKNYSLVQEITQTWLESSLFRNDQMVSKDLISRTQRLYLMSSTSNSNSRISDWIEKSHSFPADEFALIQTQIHEEQGDYVQTIKEGLAGLRILKLDLPSTLDDKRWEELASREHELVQQSLKVQGVRWISTSSHCQDKQAQKVLKMIASMVGAAFFVDFTIYSYLAFRAFRIQSERGWALGSLNIDTSIALSSSKLAHIEISYEIASLSLKRIQSEEQTIELVRLQTDFSTFIQHFNEPLRDCINSTIKTSSLAKLYGDGVYGGFCHVILARDGLILGRHLLEYQESLKQYLMYMQSLGNPVLEKVIQSFQCNANLLKPSSKEAPDEIDFESVFDEYAFPIGSVTHQIYQAYVKSFLLHEKGCLPDESSLECLGTHAHVSIFYLIKGIEAFEQNSLTSFQVAFERLEEFCTQGNSSHSCYFHFLSFLKAWLEGDEIQIVDKLDRSLEIAREQEMVIVEIWVNEFGYLYWTGKGKPHIAKVYLGQGIHLCEVHSHNAKLEAMRALYYDHFQQIMAQSNPIDFSSTVTNVTTREAIDLESLLRSAKIIASQWSIENVIHAFLGVLLENSGASHGILVTLESGRWRVLGKRSIEDTELFVNEWIELSDSHGPVELFKEVATKKDNLVLNDVLKSPLHNHTSYFKRSDCKSALFIPVLYQNELFGIAYFENNQSANTFQGLRLEILNLIASQGAGAIRNAQLLRSLELQTEQYKKTNQELNLYRSELQDLIDQKTRELKNKNESLNEEILLRRKAEMEVIESSKAREAFLANLSHEFGTPIHSIHNYAQFALKRFAKGKVDEAQSLVEKITKNSSSLKSMVHDLLDHFQLSSGKLNYKFSLNCIGELVQETLEEFEPSFIEKEIALEFHKESFQVNAQVDPTKIKQVFRNLISNALKFSDPGGLLRIQIERVESIQEAHLKILFYDTGPGVPDQEKDRIFRVFESHLLDRKGTGLGLAICHEIIFQHRGSVWVEDNSIDQKGSCFVVMIPQELSGMQR